jgi:hypothetical protein
MTFIFPIKEAKPTWYRKQRKAPRNPVILAQEWQASLAAGKYRNQAELAQHMGITRTRVTQILNLLRLEAQVIEAVIGLGDPLPGSIITERELRRLLRCPEEEQRSFAELLREKGGKKGEEAR